MRAALVLTLLEATATLFAACSSTPLHSAGTVCGSDSDCGTGLSCLGIGAFSDGGCTTTAMACSKHCSLDTDCAPLGTNFRCFGACDGTRTCAAIP
jgi:hypothetical protein